MGTGNMEFDNVQIDVTFSQASGRSNIASAENIALSFGKLSKWFEALVPEGGSSGQILGWNSSGTAKWINSPVSTDEKVKVDKFVSTTQTDYLLTGAVASMATTAAHLVVDNADGVASARMRLQKGTTDTIGQSMLMLGNNIASGTSKNMQGMILMYSSSDKYGKIVSESLTDNRTWTLPDKTGTIAMTSDITPVNNGKLTIKGGTTSVAEFTANQSSDTNFSITAGSNVTVTPDAENSKITIASSDTKVTSAANHYTPSRDTSADKTASASGATAAWSIDVVKGVTLQTDGKGHVTGLSVTSGKIPGNPIPSYNVTGSTTWTTADRILVTNAASGNVIKQSSYTIATSVPADALFTDTWIPMEGATSSADGSVGYVNAVPPKNGYNTKYLRADGTWAIPPGTYTHPTYTRTDTTSAASPAHGETFTAIDSVTSTNGHVTAVNVKTVTLPAQYVHPGKTQTDTTSTVSPAHGGTFTVVDSVTRDTSGHVSGINVKTVTLPSDQNTDTLMTQTNTTASADYRVLLSGNANDTTETTTGHKSANLRFNPSSGGLYSFGFLWTDITGQTLDIDTLTLSDGTIHSRRFIQKTDGGADNITNIPVAGHPFLLEVDLIRWASTTDYITRQRFTNAANGTYSYVRYCNKGTWGNWTTRKYTDTNTKVTSAANHYTPATASGQDKSASATGATAAWGIDVVKGVTLNTDGKGHVTGLSVTSGKIPANPVPSGALFTDENVAQAVADSSYTNYRPLLIGNSSGTSAGFTPSPTTAGVYATAGIYCQPSSGYVYASDFMTNTYPSGTGSSLSQYGLYLKSYFKCADSSQTVLQYAGYGVRTYSGKITSSDGIAMAIGCGGLTVLGSGESAHNLISLISDDQKISGNTTLNVGGTLNTTYVGNSEVAIISSDDNIYFITNCQTIANRKPVCLNTDSHFYPGTNKTGSIGTSSYMWNSVYAATIYENGTSLASKYATISHTHDSLYGVQSSSAVPVTTLVNGQLKVFYNVNNGLSGNMPATNNANAIIQINKHGGDYDSQLGFSSNGNIYYRSCNGTVLSSSVPWRRIYDTSNPPTASEVGALASTTKYAGSSSIGGPATYVGLPRVTADSKSFPGQNKVEFKEYSNTSTNTPSSAWYHIISMQGADTRYGTQLALGMTTNAVYYRNYNNQNWIDWQPLGRFTATPTTGQVVITDGTTGGIKSSGSTISPNPSSVETTNWNTASERTIVVTKGWMSWWNGAYNGTSSNLAYCKKGEFGTIITKNTGDYVPNHGDLRSTIGSDCPAADVKTFFMTSSVPTATSSIGYNTAGNEYTLIFGKGTDTAGYGAVLKFGYNSLYPLMLRLQNGTWKSTDWEKISAGYADRATYLDVVASDEIRLYNDNQFNRNNHFWIGYSWAQGSHYTPSGGTNTASTTAPNITKYVIGNCSGGGLAGIHAASLILGQGDAPTSSSATSTLKAAAGTTGTYLLPSIGNGTYTLSCGHEDLSAGSGSLTSANVLVPSYTKFIKIVFKSDSSNTLYSMVEIPYFGNGDYSALVQVGTYADGYQGSPRIVMKAIIINIANGSETGKKTFTITGSPTTKINGSNVSDVTRNISIYKIYASD